MSQEVSVSFLLVLTHAGFHSGYVILNGILVMSM